MRVILTPRQSCDLELIINGGFYPLKTFLSKIDYESVINNMRLSNNILWPIPVVLDLKEEVPLNTILELVDPSKDMYVKIKIEEVYIPNKQLEVEKIYKTSNIDHFGVSYIINRTNDYYVTGPLEVIKWPTYYNFVGMRMTPEQVITILPKNRPIIGFQTRNPLHRSHYYLIKSALEETGGHVLLHPVVGCTKDDDIDYVTRVKCYLELLKYFDKSEITISLLPLAMRMAGPREALWHSIIRKNFGVTHFIIGRDHAGTNNTYGAYEAQELVKKYEGELGIKILCYNEVVYIENRRTYLSYDKISSDDKVLSISGTQLRKMLFTNVDIPEWFSFPEIIRILKNNRGLTIFFTGLSGAGKSTLSEALILSLEELTDRRIISLDGDEVRKNLSEGLGFSKEDRDKNIRKIGYVASLISSAGAISVISAIAPYENTRDYVRDIVSKDSNFVLIHVSTPLNKCEERDIKGLYKRARLGEITQFTGISAPYEIPKNPDLVIDTSNTAISEGVKLIINYLKNKNLIN